MSERQLEIRKVHPSQPDVAALLEFHLQVARAVTPEGLSFALDQSALAQPGIALFGIFVTDRLVAIGALSELGADEVEVKSMRVDPGETGKGYGRAMLDYLIAEARRRGASTVRLETGKTDTYIPANALYSSAGFVETGPFADYRESDFNRFYALEL